MIAGAGSNRRALSALVSRAVGVQAIQPTDPLLIHRDARDSTSRGVQPDPAVGRRHQLKSEIGERLDSNEDAKMQLVDYHRGVL
jgi:hypothetical protein